MPLLTSFPKIQFRNLFTAKKTRSTVQQKILDFAQNAIENNKPHFKVGGTQLYFPKARVILLRSNAKHTPYQAKFIVPKSFNKLDLRDYLYNLYGLRALNITTQLLHAKHTRIHPGFPRYREPQIKKMTIDMMEPFIWPEEPKNTEPWMVNFTKESETYRNENMALGSDKNKPGTAFGGALGPYKEVAQPFIPKLFKRRMINRRNRVKEEMKKLNEYTKIEKYISAPTKHFK